MSVTTWINETPTAAQAISAKPRAVARQLGFGIGLVMATGTAYATILLAVLMASSIIQF